MDLSCGVLVTDGDTILLCHVTGAGNRWDIPKGQPDPGEDHMDAALRELKEETGIELPEMYANVKELGYTSYTKTKDLYLVRFEGYIDPMDMSCTSYFYDKNWKSVPEVDGFKYFKFSEISKFVTPNLYNVLSKYLGIK